MPSEKRVRTDEMSKETSGKDYAVCDQCRIKKIRCGREKPFCSNCTRLGHKCEWSGNGKKGNQTVLLSHTIEALSKRLESLENALAETQNAVKLLVSGTTTGVDVLAALQSNHTWPTPEDTTPIRFETPVFQRPVGHFIRGHDVEDSERYFDPTSLESLLYNIRDTILEPIVNDKSRSQSVRECALLAQQKFDFLVSREEESVQNGILPTAPPIPILKAMVEPYFATINPHLPIWTKDSFVRIVTALQESDSSDQDLGQVVCSNNLVLMTLAANLSHPPPHSDKLRRFRPIHKSSSIDQDLAKGFLASAKRAIRHAELLLSPRLINVQALLSLCVVAQEHMSPSVFAKLFSLAAQGAKSIGLHDWERGVRERVVDESSRERQCVSYCLYILDKTVCWTVGASPRIPASDICIDATPKSLNNGIMDDLVAKVKLAEINEEIYREIYACRAPARTEEQVRLQISKLDQRLQAWLTDAGIDLDDIGSAAPSGSISKIQMSVGSTCTQLLYMWPFREHPDVMSRRLEASRRCMKLMLHLWRFSAELGYQGIFPRIVASHPPLYLYEICAHLLLEEEEGDSDQELLRSFTEMLQGVTNLQEDDSYNKRLCEVSTILMEVVVAMETGNKRRKMQHAPSPSSTLLSSSASPSYMQLKSPYTPSTDACTQNFESNTSPIQGSSQGTSSLAISGFESLIPAANSGPLEKGSFETFDLLGYSEPQVARGESLVDGELWWN
ncbi:fungal-specific transcription factor domain-containing protein [Hypoxylon sp. FL1857]|nr:fungal-specific transcription factor domain-containing protein [Hypoxylon sp. FL1857]